MGNLSLNNALSGVLASQQALDVISQNVSNAEDENHSRQRAILKSNRPLFQDGKIFGAGVNVEEVVHHRDTLSRIGFFRISRASGGSTSSRTSTSRSRPS